MTKPTKRCIRCGTGPHLYTIGLPDTAWHEVCRPCAIAIDREGPAVFSLLSPSWEPLPMPAPAA